MLVVFAAFAVCGCSRHFYRQKADGEAYSVIASAAADSRWGLHDYTIAPSVTSRHFDPSCPDNSPMPCDDPTAHRLMHCVDGKSQRQCKLRNCKQCAMAQLAENPMWRSYLNVSAGGTIMLDSETAVTLGLRHSPDYQTQLEKVYLAALDVSQERFRYDVQFFGGDSIYYTSNGAVRGATNWENSFTTSAQKKTAIGGEFIVSLANSITWNLTGPDRFDSSSLISLNIVQPLLRGAGREIVLESLTQSERNLLYSIRQLAFFRQGFYARIVTGSGGPAGGGSGGGYYPILVEKVRLLHQANNIDGIADNLERMQQLFDAGKRIRALQLEQTRAQLLTSQSSLITQQSRYATLIETYIRSLGLPPDLKVDPKDDVLEQFYLIPESVREEEKRLAELVTEVRAAPDLAKVLPQLKFAAEASRREMKAVWHDVSFLEQRRGERIAGLQSLAAHLASAGSGDKIDSRLFDPEVFKRGVAATRDSIARHDKMVQAVVALVELTSRQSAEQMVRMIRMQAFDESAAAAIKLLEFKGGIGEDTTLTITKEVDARDVTTGGRSSEEIYREWLVRLASRLHSEMSEIALWRARARLDAIVLTPVTLDLSASLASAEANRLDWMNRRSELVDKWRAINIAADRLKGDLSVKLRGETGTLDGNGIKFDAKNSSLKVGLEWDSPLTRHSEMVAYRRAQIAYQAGRRDYTAFVDGVSADIRDTHRLLLSQQINFEVQRAAIGVAIIETTLAQLELERPQSGGSSYNTNLANDIVSALQRLLNAQNSFIEIYFAYETQRILLALRTGTMTLDDRGMWNGE
ncbi:MAG: TolC family protein [Thermoguttaceae bacterium]